MKTQTIKRILAVLGLLLLVFLTEKVVEYFVLPLYSTTVSNVRERRALDGTITNAFVGASLTADGIDPQLMDEKLGGVSYNFGTNGQTMVLTKHLVKDVLATNPVENVFIEVSVRRMIKDGDDDLGVGRVAFIEYMADPWTKLNFIREEFTLSDIPSLFVESVRCQLRFFIDDPKTRFQPAYLKEYLKNGYVLNTTDNYVGRGYKRMSGANRPGRVGVVPEYPSNANLVFQDEGVDNVVELERILKLCTDNGLRPVLYAMPITDAYLMSFSDRYADIYQLFKDTAEANGGEFIDLNFAKPLRAQLTDAHFTDNRHLNAEGSKIVSEFLGDVLAGKIGQEAFYPTYEQMASSIERVGGVSLRYSHSRGAFGVEAYYSCGLLCEPEFRFFVGPKDAKKQDMKMVRDYAPSSKLSLMDLPAGRYSVAVQARDARHPERDHDSYWVMQIKVTEREKNA